MSGDDSEHRRVRSEAGKLPTIKSGKDKEETTFSKPTAI